MEKITFYQQSEAIKKFLKREAEDYYKQSVLLPPLREFWATQFPPALAKKLLTRFKKHVEIRLDSLDMEGTSIHYEWKDGGTANKLEQRWKMVWTGCMVWFSGVNRTDQRMVKVGLEYNAALWFTLIWHDSRNIEIVEVEPDVVSVYHISVILGRNTVWTIPPTATVAKYDALNKRFTVDRKGIEEIAEHIATLMHCEIGGINTWLWEIGKKLVDRLDRELKGEEVSYTPTGGEEEEEEEEKSGRVKITGVEISPPDAGGNYIVTSNIAKGMGVRKDIVGIRYPIKVHTEGGKKFRGEIGIDIAFLQPSRYSKHPIVPRIELDSVYVFIEGILHTLMGGFSKEITVEERKLPHPQDIIDEKVLQKVISIVRGKLRYLASHHGAP